MQKIPVLEQLHKKRSITQKEFYAVVNNTMQGTLIATSQIP
jgi:hypothetical protein